MQLTLTRQSQYHRYRQQKAPKDSVYETRSHKFMKFQEEFWNSDFVTRWHYCMFPVSLVRNSEWSIKNWKRSSVSKKFRIRIRAEGRVAIWSEAKVDGWWTWSQRRRISNAISSTDLTFGLQLKSTPISCTKFKIDVQKSTQRAQISLAKAGNYPHTTQNPDL